LALVTVILLVIVAFFITGFEVEVVGLLGVIQENAKPGSSVQTFSPLLIAQKMIEYLPSDSDGGIIFGTYCLVITFSLCVLVVPIMESCFLLWIWVVPCNVATLKVCLRANEILASFQYMEVYIIAVLVGCLQIPVVCDLLVGDKCDDIQWFLNLLVTDDKTTHATCFQMVPKVKAGLWLHFAASFILYFAHTTVRELAMSTVRSIDPIKIQQSKPLTKKQQTYCRDRVICLKNVCLAVLTDPSEPKPEPKYFEKSQVRHETDDTKKDIKTEPEAALEQHTESNTSLDLQGTAETKTRAEENAPKESKERDTPNDVAQPETGDVTVN